MPSAGAATGAIAPSAYATTSIDRGKLNYNTHRFISQARRCVSVVGLIGLLSQTSPSTYTMADATTKARDICDGIRSSLLRIDTGHFDNQANETWYGVDRMKSGLNALLNYLDTSASSKLIESRNKLVDGLGSARAGVRAINSVRRSYGLRAV